MYTAFYIPNFKLLKFYVTNVNNCLKLFKRYSPAARFIENRAAAVETSPQGRTSSALTYWVTA